MSERPLYAQLAQLLVAFTIEADNAFEERVPHRTTAGKGSASTREPWLVSLALWLLVLQYVDPGGITIRDLRRRACLAPDACRTWLVRLSKWWGYLRLEPAAPGTDAASRIVRPAAGGGRALEAWPAVLAEVEARWEERFGAAPVARLRTALETLTRAFETDLPAFVPILGAGLRTQVHHDSLCIPHLLADEMRALPLPTLLARVLTAYALAFERETDVPLAVYATVLRVLDAGATPVRDLPARGGISKEAVDIALGVLERSGLVIRASVARARVVTLTTAGVKARERSAHVAAAIGERWRREYGSDTLHALSTAVQALFEPVDGAVPRLAAGLVPPAAGWRAQKPYAAHSAALARDPLALLPHFPMVLHRGGWPDGS